MAGETAFVYSGFVKSLLNKEINVNTDTFKAMLTTSTYTPDQDAHQYKSSVTNEVSGTGYTAGGATATLTAAYNSSTNVWTIDCSDLSWATATFTARRMVIYDATPGSDATRPLVCWVDFGADKSPSAGTFSVTIDSTGIVKFTIA